MNISMSRAALMICCVVGFFVGSPSPAWAEKADASSQATFDRLVAAIQNKDVNKFLENATDEMKKAITPALMEQMNRDLGTRLQKGFEASYLADLKKQGCVVKLWKVSFKDGGDDVVLRVVMKGDLLAGFFMQ